MKITNEIKNFASHLQSFFHLLVQMKLQNTTVKLFLCALGAGFFEILFSMAYARIMDEIMLDALWPVLLVCGLCLAKSGAILFQTMLDWLGRKNRNTMIAGLRHEMMHAIMNMDFEYFLMFSKGELVDKIQASAFDLADNLGMFLPDLFRHIVIGTLTLIAAFCFAPALSAVFAVLCTLMLSAQIYGGKFCEKPMNEMIAMRNTRDSCIHELLSQTKTIQIFDLEAFEKKRFHQSSGHFITSFSKAMQHLASAFSPARILNDCAILILCPGRLCGAPSCTVSGPFFRAAVSLEHLRPGMERARRRIRQPARTACQLPRPRSNLEHAGRKNHFMPYSRRSSNS